MMPDSIRKATAEEIKNAILNFYYKRFFEEKIDDYFDAKAFSKSYNYDEAQVFEAIEEFREKGFIKTECAGGFYEFGPDALDYCEINKLVPKSLILKQHSIRIKLLTVLFDLQKNTVHNDGPHWEDWIRESCVDEDDFNRNIVKNHGVYFYNLTSEGKTIVDDYRKRKKRLEAFEKLDKLEGLTRQERGHKLEDLLAETATWENWEVKTRVRSQGQEHDIIMHVGLHYFLSSCKWEGKPVQPKEVELLESRVRSRAQANGGILFSMSGFTKKCIEEIRMKIACALVIPFGPKDINQIMRNEISMTKLLDNKIDEIMNHRKILVDNELK
jgi:hypothetical protein